METAIPTLQDVRGNTIIGDVNLLTCSSERVPWILSFSFSDTKQDVLIFTIESDVTVSGLFTIIGPFTFNTWLSEFALNFTLTS